MIAIDEGLPGSPSLLARFVLREGWIRQQDKTLRPDAFMPPPDLRFSVTDHGQLCQDALWRIGLAVAVKRQLKLFGRGDISSEQLPQHGLSLEAAPLDDNPNHCHIVGWPTDKSAVKSIAQQLAAAAAFVPLTVRDSL